MKRTAMALTLMVLFCSWGVAQESTSREQKPREAESREQRSSGRERRQYDQKKLQVEDPAAFKAEGEPVFSGPQPGEKMATLKVMSLAGDLKGKEIDPIALADGGPQILFFQDESGVAIRGLFGVVRSISKITQNTEQKVHITCVFLSDDPDSITSRYGQLFPRLREQGIDVVAISTEGRDGPGAYGLDRTVSQTVILAKNGKVTRNFVFRQGMLLADPHVLGGIAELLDEDQETVAGWLNEANTEAAPTRMSRENAEDPQAAGKSALREKLGELVRAGKLTREEAGEVYQAAFPSRR
ncbi:MAG: hypothetical protein VYC80_16860 [Planctomycetota bacterium]|nr:hypothetical protein [Planctomycetota bacterium]MEC7450564.1 hypothetical protein [Planctomycetota bacterium]